MKEENENTKVRSENESNAENESEAEIELENLERAYHTLGSLGSAEFHPQRKSTWEVEQLAFFKSPEHSDELKIPPLMIAAYYFSKKILNHFDPDVKVAYDTYQALLAVCQSWKGFDEIEQCFDDDIVEDIGWEKNEFSNLVELIVKYLSSNELDTAPGGSRVKVDHWCRSFCEAYQKILSVYKKYRANCHAVSGDIEHPHYRLGNAALILEYLFTQVFEKQIIAGTTTIVLKNTFKDNTSLVALQNLFVDQFVLASMEKKSLGFMTETQYTIAEILTFNRAELVAWFITNEIQKKSPLKYTNSEQDKTRKELFKLLKKECDEYVKNTRGDNSIKETADYYLTTLTAQKVERGFDETAIAWWIEKIQKIMIIYNYCSHVRGRMQTESMIIDRKLQHCRAVIAGDSVSVGYGLAKNAIEDEQCYVKIVPRLLQEQTGIKVDFANCSVIGYETSHGTAIIKRELDAIKPHFVIISLGGNDAFQKVKVSEILKNLEAIVAECIKTTKVIVALGIPQTFSVSEDKEYRKEFFDILSVLKQKYDVETLWLPEKLLIRDNIQADKLHFKPEIQKPLAELAVKSIKPVLMQIERELQAYTDMIPKICFSTALQGDSAYPLSKRVNQGKPSPTASPTEIILSYLNYTVKSSFPTQALMATVRAAGAVEHSVCNSRKTPSPNGGYQL